MGQPTGVAHALRCSTCGIDWPNEVDYLDCPSCGEPTDRCSVDFPVDPAEARSLKLTYEFEKFYEQWDSEHPPERLQPDFET